jgi:hypothetical protein
MKKITKFENLVHNLKSACIPGGSRFALEIDNKIPLRKAL